MKRILLVAGLIAAFALGMVSSTVWADKTFSRTYYSVILSDVTEIRFTRMAGVPNGWTFTGTSNVRASDGVGYTATYTTNASAGQKTQIETFATNNILAGTNTQDGL